MKLFQLMTPESGFEYHYARTLFIFLVAIDNRPTDPYSEHNSMFRSMTERYSVWIMRRSLIFDGISEPLPSCVKTLLPWRHTMSTKTKRFPITLQIRKHLKIEVDLLRPADIKDLMKLYSSLEDSAISRIPWHVNSPNHPKLIKRLIEDDRAHFLSALHKGEIIGSISLHHNPALWTGHIGSVVFVSHPDYRRYGIASALFEEIIPFAQSLNIEKLYAQLTKENVQGIRMLKHFGFTREATFKDHIKDSYGRYQDMRVYSLDLEGAHKAMADLIANFSDYSG